MMRSLRSTFSKRCYSAIISQYRCYLSDAYHCDEEWRNRLQDPLVKDVKPVEFYYEILRKYKKEGKVSAIDTDLFMNRIQSEGKEILHDEMEEILLLLRRSPETVKTLASTPHAVLRHMMKHDRTDLILKMISDTTNYGIFPCHYLSNLMMDYFNKKKDYTASARVASRLMLQEDYGPPLTQSLIMYSCYMYAFNGEANATWVDYNPVVEPEEEIKIRVDYLRNPYFDDHFDIKDANQMIGKTLAWLVQHLDTSESIKVNTEVLGWSMYQKYNELIEALKNAKNGKISLDKKVVEIVAKSLENCENVELKGSLEGAVKKLKSESLVKDVQIIEQLDKLLKESFEQSESKDIENQVSVYRSWSNLRQKALNVEMERLERVGLIQEIEDKKKYLKKREDILFFFDHKLKLELKNAELKEMETKVEDVEEEYSPPELR